MSHQLVLAEPPEPLVRCVHPAVEVERQGKALEQVCDGVGLTRSLPVGHRGLGQVVGDAPGHRPAVEHRHDVWLAALELVAQQLVQEVVVAIPLASSIEGHDEAVRALECIEHVRRLRRLQDGVAQSATHAMQDRGAFEELRLGRRQPGQELEAEVLRHEPVVAREARRVRRVRRAGQHRQSREVQAGRPTLGSLGQLGELVRVERDSRGL
jgi:hypothetical protein